MALPVGQMKFQFNVPLRHSVPEKMRNVRAVGALVYECPVCSESMRMKALSHRAAAQDPIADGSRLDLEKQKSRCHQRTYGGVIPCIACGLFDAMENVGLIMSAMKLSRSWEGRYWRSSS